MKKRIISAWLALRGVIDYESVAKAQAESEQHFKECTALAQMLHKQDEALYLYTQEMDAGRRQKMLTKVLLQVEQRRLNES